jgi:large subunit ribosomal protein L31e
MSESETKEETKKEIEGPEEEEVEEAGEEEIEAPTEEEALEEKEEPEEEKAVETTPAAEEKEEEEGEAEEEIEVVEEKIYTIPLRHVWITPRGKRAPRALRYVRDFVTRNMKAEEVAMSNEINEAVWARGINKPPRKIRVRAVKDKEGKVIVYPAKAA